MQRKNVVENKIQLVEQQQQQQPVIVCKVHVRFAFFGNFQTN